jgi:hypothetical protein
MTARGSGPVAAFDSWQVFTKLYHYPRPLDLVQRRGGGMAQLVPPQGAARLQRPAERRSSGDVSVFAYFTPDGAVEDKAFLDFGVPRPSLRERLRQWLGW